MTDSRTKMIETGLQLMLGQGFNYTGIQPMLEAAQAPKGSFYYYFKNKQDFGEQVLAYYNQIHGGHIMRLLGDQSQSPLERLRAYFDFYITYNQNNQCREGCLIGMLSQELSAQNEPFRHLLRESLDQWQGAFEQCLTEAQTQGEIRAGRDLTQLARFCLNGYQGALLRMKATKDITHLTDFVDQFFDFIRP